MPIAEGKKRYYLTLDQESMDRAQELVKELRLPRQTVSLVIDEYLRTDLVPRLTDILEKKRSGEQLSFGEMFISVGSSNLVTTGDHRGEMVEFHLETDPEGEKPVLVPKPVDENS
ncbi:MAG: hypothetical protein IMY82_01295 [Chloroflexi bacterium]|nr:hypothetical protein [Chloroflexota bacterium]